MRCHCGRILTARSDTSATTSCRAGARAENAPQSGVVRLDVAPAMVPTGRKPTVAA
ncbi:hypothetical protein [Kibdelosporangium philippinense]|uniref:hypothetical protein n=1 Tax=Kibdelosporangium philippinense TaxID=211113 RepID=UPI003622B4A9